MVSIQTEDGKTLAQKIQEILSKVKSNLDKASKVVSLSIAATIRRHFQSIYPGSKHYAPSKVTVKPNGAVNIDVPGISRAYHDLNIRAKNGKFLTIPFHRDAFGIPARNIDKLFYVKNKKGTEMLAKNEGGRLVVMYILKESVHQRRDPGLMPSDATILRNITSAVSKYLDRQANK